MFCFECKRKQLLSSSGYILAISGGAWHSTGIPYTSQRNSDYQVVVFCSDTCESNFRNKVMFLLDVFDFLEKIKSK